MPGSSASRVTSRDQRCEGTRRRPVCNVIVTGNVNSRHVGERQGLEMGKANPAAIGVDFGTASVRAVVVDTLTGEELGDGEYAYRHGTDGVVTVPGNPHLARQSARDYVDGLRVSIRRALDSAEEQGFDRRSVVGIGVGTTGSSPI